MKKTLYISDLDGTLLNHSAQLCEASATIINKIIRAGGLFTYATARSFTSSRPITAALDLTLPIATYNGAFLVSPDNGETIAGCAFEHKGAIALVNQVMDAGFCPAVNAIIDGRERVSYYTGNISRGTAMYLEGRAGDRRLRAVDEIAGLYEGEVFYMTIIGEEEALSPLVCDVTKNMHVGHSFQRDTYQDDFWLELFPREASKARAVELLRAHTGAERVVCFGDNKNDIPMFMAADECYAVENACDELKAVASGVVAANTANGVARWIEADFSAL